MSSKRAEIPSETAKVEAEKILRFEIGNLPHLGEARYEDATYVFPVNIRIPRVIFDEERSDPIEVKFMDEETIGRIEIDAETGEFRDRTNLSQIQQAIRQKKNEVDIAVQKALVKASAEKFSLLPFPEHRYTPLQDLLAEVILSGQITEETLDELNASERAKYEEYTDTLAEVDLLRWQDDRITAADTLIGIEADTDYPSEALDAALAHFFSEGADNYEMIQGILGPYLAIAGYYYRRSLESEDMPSVAAREFRDEIRSQYSGQESVSKAFKTSRYLLQLEEVGILQSESNQTGRNWRGFDDVFQDLLQQREQLEPIAEIIA